MKELRIYWLQYKPTDYLFPGKTADKTYADTSIQKAIKAAAKAAGIKRRVYPHVLRHSYLETQVEGAKESKREAPPPIQLYFPGMTSRIPFEIESF